MNPARAEAAARVLPTFANARGQARFSSRRDTTRAKVCAGARARPEASRRQKARNDEGRAMGQSTRAKSSVLAGSFAHIGLGQATLSRELSKALHNGADIRSIQHYDPANDGEFIEES